MICKNAVKIRENVVEIEDMIEYGHMMSQYGGEHSGIQLKSIYS